MLRSRRATLHVDTSAAATTTSTAIASRLRTDRERHAVELGVEPLDDQPAQSIAEHASGHEGERGEARHLRGEDARRPEPERGQGRELALPLGKRDAGARKHDAEGGQAGKGHEE